MHPAERLAKTREDFIEKIGIIAQSEGLPRIAGRLFALLIFEGRRYSFGELAQVLQVSRGSISSSVRLLEGRGVVKRLALPGDRQDYFQLADSPYETLLGEAAVRARMAHREISDTIAELPESEAAVLARLRDLAGFYDAIDTSVTQAVRGLNTRKKA